MITTREHPPVDQSGDPQPDQQSPDDPGGSPSLAQSLRRNWQVPALGLGVALLIAGIVTTIGTRPGPDLSAALDDAKREIGQAEYTDAIAVLNDRVYPYLDRPEMTPAIRRSYHLLLARALHGGQSRLEIPQRINDENAVKQFLEAERRDAALTPGDLEALAESYLALDLVERAHTRVRQIPAADRARRDKAYRMLVEHELDRRDPRLESALAILQDQLADPGLPAAERSWALARQAEIQIDQGFADDAITLLLRHMPVLVADQAPGLGDLYLQLGRAYLEVDALAEAERELTRADDDRLLEDNSNERAHARLLLAEVDARLAHEDGRLASARERFQEIVERDGSTDSFAPAMLGLAESAALLDDLPAAYEAYESLVAEAKANPQRRRPSTDEIQESLLQQYSRQAELGSAADALRFATLAGSLSTLQSMPTEVLLALADAHRASAAAALGSASDDPVRLVIEGRIDPATQQEAKRHLIRAAGYYNAHAERAVLEDYDTHLDSLWNAAVLYDRAGDKLEAVRTFSAFIDAAQGDPRRPEARYRLGQTYQSRGEYGLAAEQYRGLIDERNSGGTPEVGTWADSSFVPLAQCLIADGDPANDAEAEQALASVLDGTSGGPGRPEFRDALVELGRLQYRRGEYGPAQERFTELLERFPDDPRAAEVRYRLADTRRKIASAIEDRLEQPLRDAEARDLRVARADHLSAALALFEQVRDELDDKPALERTPLEEVFLRNSVFYLGDAAFDLGDYRGAISYYNAARKKYPRDPSVLVAMTQIVSAYLNIGDLTSARAAQERAKGFYATLPESVWDDPHLPMTREDWERWLDSSARLYESVSAGG